jgi:hypothetical protein
MDTHLRIKLPPGRRRLEDLFLYMYRRNHRVGVRFPEGLKLLHFYTEFPA